MLNHNLRHFEEQLGVREQQLTAVFSNLKDDWEKNSFRKNNKKLYDCSKSLCKIYPLGIQLYKCYIQSISEFKLYKIHKPKFVSFCRYKNREMKSVVLLILNFEKTSSSKSKNVRNRWFVKKTFVVWCRLYFYCIYYLLNNLMTEKIWI
jgi:hypothetical protein